MTEKWVFNAAYTNSLARPAYFELVPYEEVILDDLEIAKGNSSLEATVSNNFDLIGEHYFSDLGIVSFGGFAKNINNWLYEYKDNDYDHLGDGQEWELTQVRNGHKASVLGFEFGLQSRLHFLPGVLSNLTFYGNYTFTDATTDGVEGRKDVPLVGAVKNMANGSLAFETNKVFFRTSLNYSGEALDAIGEEAWEDEYYDEQLFLDINAAYTINERIRVFAEFKNLTNQPLRYYRGSQDRTQQIEYYNFNWNMGIKIDL